MAESKVSLTRALRLTGLIVLLATLLAPTTVMAQSRVRSSFDHFTTGFELDGAHRFADCESCHMDGMFVGTPTQCAGCHTNASRIRAATKPAKHALSSQNCEACHRTSAWAPIVRMDHLEAFGQCADCHNGRKFAGKPVSHIPSSEQCDDCHRTTAWVPAAFDHSGIFGNCFSCHNGTVATGKIVNHIPATNFCEDCHNTMTFSPVARVDHMQVIGTCSSCHNGAIATGQHPQHIPTTAECDTCHNTMAWRP